MPKKQKRFIAYKQGDSIEYFPTAKELFNKYPTVFTQKAQARVYREFVKKMKNGKPQEYCDLKTGQTVIRYYYNQLYQKGVTRKA